MSGGMPARFLHLTLSGAHARSVRAALTIARAVLECPDPAVPEAIDTALTPEWRAAFTAALRSLTGREPQDPAKARVAYEAAIEHLAGFERLLNVWLNEAP